MNPRSLCVYQLPFVWVEGKALVPNMAHRGERFLQESLLLAQVAIAWARPSWVAPERAAGKWAVRYF